MTKAESLRVLKGLGDLDFEGLDGALRAFGFLAHSPDFETEVYYHPVYKSCGLLTAREYTGHIVTPRQREIALAMVACVQFHEQAERWKGTP